MNTIQRSEEIAKMFLELQKDPEFLACGEILKIVDSLFLQMQKKKLTFKLLARKLKWPVARVKDFFSGNPKMTFQDIFLIANATGPFTAEFKISFVDEPDKKE